MNTNRTRPTSTNLDVQPFIRRCEIAYDERARFVEFVCNVWNEGRFGPNLSDPVTVKWNDRPDLEPASFLDFDDSGRTPRDGQYTTAACRFVSTLGRGDDQAAAVAFRRANQMGLIDTRPNPPNSTSALTPNQGRGSP